MYACICVVHAFRFEMFLKFRPLLIFYLCPFKFWFHVFASSYACWCCCWRQSGCLVGWLAVIPYGDDVTAGSGFPGGCRLRWRCWLIDFDGVTSSWRIRKYTQMEFCDFFYANKHTYLYTYIHTYKHTYIPIINIVCTYIYADAFSFIFILFIVHIVVFITKNILPISSRYSNIFWGVSWRICKVCVIANLRSQHDEINLCILIVRKIL